MPAPSPPPSKAGILTTPTGQRHIPSSLRPDGSVRKEIKIRPGYRPPEDVEVYKNRTAEAWKTRGSGGVPGADAMNDDDGKATAGGKNAKRREARKKARAVNSTAGGDEAEGEVGEEEGPGASAGSSAGAVSTITNGQPTKTNTKVKKSASDTTAKPDEQAKPAEPTDPEAEKEKQARTLRKKLRQARELKEKKDSGANLLPEQFEKVIRISELIRQLDALGFDAEGESKKKTDKVG
ncbi:MAG: hypothetical protein M1819_002436 [Sarea resinae]|nr:MAG: hypothetical protein M1819_002436 [Sarea resinae]